MPSSLLSLVSATSVFVFKLVTSISRTSIYLKLDPYLDPNTDISSLAVDQQYK